MAAESRLNGCSYVVSRRVRRPLRSQIACDDLPERGERDRFRQVICKSGVDALLAIAFHRGGRDGEDRCELKAGVAAQFSHDAESVTNGHVNIEEDQIGRAGIRLGKRVFPVDGLDDFVTDRFQSGP